MIIRLLILIYICDNYKLFSLNNFTTKFYFDIDKIDINMHT